MATVVPKRHFQRKQVQLMRILSKRVYAARDRKGWTVDDLAHVARVATRSVSYIENLEHLPSVQTLLKISLALDVPLIDLMRMPRKRKKEEKGDED